MMPFRRQFTYRKSVVLSVAACASAGLIVLLFAGAGDNDESSRQRLENLSLAEQEELRRKSEAFESLDENERDRMRELHVAITSSADSQRLQSVMLKYHEWLKTLPAKERAELLGLPPSARVERIRQLMEEQRQQRFRDLVRTTLSPEDVRAIFQWLDTYAENHQEELLTLIPEQMRERVKQSSAHPTIQRKMLMMAVGSRGNDVQFPLPSDDELAKLSDSLSENAKKALAELPGKEQQMQLVREWLRASVASRLVPQVSDERLLAFYRDYRERTSDKKRIEELDSLPPEQFYDEVRKIYFRSRSHWRTWPGSDPRRGQGGHPGDRDRRPPGDGNRAGHRHPQHEDPQGRPNDGPDRGGRRDRPFGQRDGR